MFIQYIFLIFQAYLLAICKTKKKSTGFSNFEKKKKNVFTWQITFSLGESIY